MKYYLTLVFVGIYCSMTIFFTLPENYLLIKSDKFEKIFSSVLYQRWSFFAPPPKANDRIYFRFVDSKKRDTISMEILKPLSISRKKQFPFNSDVTVLDYILSNNLTLITDELRDNYSVFKLDNKNKDDYERFFKKHILILQEKKEMRTLLNYGLKILSNSKKNNNIDKVTIIATEELVTKFSERNSKKKKQENIVFKTNFYNLNTKKWEN